MLFDSFRLLFIISKFFELFNIYDIVCVTASGVFYGAIAP